MFLLMLPGQIMAECIANQVALELDRSMFSKDNNKCYNIWGSYSFYDQNFNVVKSETNSTTSQLLSWNALRTGINYPLQYGLKLRAYVEKGSQQGSRVKEPKQVSTDFWGTDLRIQWSKSMLSHYHLSVEVGYRLHKLPPVSYNRLEQGSILAVSAPGKSLMDVSAKDEAWIISGMLHSDVTDTFSIHAGLEMRDIEVQATTISQDPLIQSLLEIQQVPQATPWQEKHLIIKAGIDWQVVDKVGISLDYKKYNIKRSNYQIRTNFIDYNESTQFDLYLRYYPKNTNIFFIHSRYVSNYLLGDTPSFYNRRNNHTFKNPFGFITVGVQF